MSNRSTVKNLGFTLAAVFLGLALIEGSFRLVRSIRGSDWRGSPFDKAFYHAFPPGWREAIPSSRTDGVFRIVALGGSTTRGWPYGPTAAFPAWIEAALSDPEKDRRIEVVNLGMDSLDSGDEVEIMEALQDRPVDLWLVYSGHNEFSGHYFLDDPLGEGGPGSLRRLLLDHSVTAQWIQRRKIAWLREKQRQGSLALLMRLNREFIFTDDPESALRRFPFPEAKRQAILDRFLANVDRMIDLAGKDRVLFIAPVSNPLGFEPVRSLHHSSVLPENRQECETHMKHGWAALSSDPGSAAAEFGEAVKKDPWYAAAWHGLAVACLPAGEAFCTDESADAAVENESVMHRLPPSFRAQLIERLHARGVSWVDPAPSMAIAPSLRTPDPNLFLDFVHPTVEGHRRIAEAALPWIQAHSGVSLPSSILQLRMDRHAQHLSETLDLRAYRNRIPGGLGWFYLTFGNEPSARRWLEQAVRIQPEAAEAWVYLAVARHRLGEAKAARAAVREAYRLQGPTLEGLLGTMAEFEAKWLPASSLPNGERAPESALSN